MNLNVFSITTLVGLSACATESKQAPAPPSESFAAACGRGDVTCAAINGALLLMSVASKPISAAGMRGPDDSLMGHCSIKIGARKMQPCAGVVLELKSRDIGDRRAWIDGYDFEVPAVGRAPLELTAYSERYDAHAKLASVKVGSFLNVQIEVAEPR